MKEKHDSSGEGKRLFLFIPKINFLSYIYKDKEKREIESS